MVTPGRLDNTSGKENFLRWNADVMRLQNLGGRWTAYGRLSTQNASKNLNSAEKFLLGGPTGVRGYPTGEASGDEGWLTQLEVRYAFDEATTPYAFYDHGRVKVNAYIASVTSPAADKERAGYGAGVRHVRGRWSVDGALGWRSKGGAPESVTGKDPKPRIWLNASYRF